MKPMKKKVLDDVLSRPQICARTREGMCSGRLTIEHAFGRKSEESWQCVWLCWYHHLGAGLRKDLNRLLAYKQAKEEDFTKYPKSRQAWEQEKEYLLTKYPEYKDSG